MTSQAFDIKEKLASLEAALLAKSPEMPTLLQTIHRQLKKDPHIVTLLSEEECNILVEGLKKQTSTTISASAIKKTTKPQSRMTVDDL